MLTLASSRNQRAGFSIVELMVALAAGLILLSSVLGLVVSNLHNNASTVKAIRLTEESRALTEVFTRELRRVRFNGNALSQVGSGSLSTIFDNLAVANSGACIMYAYDADSDGIADDQEFRMFSLATVSGVGVVRFGKFANAASVDCSLGEIISSEDINVSSLLFTDATVRIDFALTMNMALDATTTSARTTSGSIMLRSGNF